MLVQILAYLAVAYGVLLVTVFLFQDRLIFFPDRRLAATPAAVGLAYEDVRIEASDGVVLHGWYLPGADDGRTLLFFHGNAGNISHRLDSLSLFHGLGLSVLILDYRGYGLSDGRPDERGTYRDAEAAWRHLTETRGVAPGRIVLFGRSLGASVAAWLAASTRPAGLVVESSFSSVPDLAADIYPFLPVRLLARARYDTRARLSEVRCPVLVVHSRDDEIIPFRHGEALFAAAGEPKRLLVIRGNHNDGFLASGADYVQGLSEFLESLPAPP